MIVFISCVKKKREYSCPAKDLYDSDLFRKSYSYACKIADKVYILSAKYGLLDPNEVIEPYNQTLNGKSEKYKKLWAYKVYQQFIKAGGDCNEKSVFLCGENYRKCIISKFPNAVVPLKGYSFGNQLKWYKEHL